MIACVRPDCDGGLLDDDGMCTMCCRGPEAAGHEVSTSAGRRCPRGDCEGGTLDESGICDRCSREEPAAGWPLVDVAVRGPAAAPPVWWRADDRLIEAEAGPRAPLVTPVGSASHALARSKLGLGLIDIDEPPTVDPTSKLLVESDIKERERRCPNPACSAVLGSGAAGSPPAAEGVCPVCRTAFSFRPTLGAGERLGAQYLIEGCIGYGGQGRVYLARDRNLDGERVAVKGLRGDLDQRAMDTLAAEKHTLIRVRHPDIVDIRNFVSRPRETGDDQFDVFIVLEFIAGVSLNDKKLQAQKVFPPGEAISYVLATLPALGYLHESKLVYGDFKPANVMHVGDRVKLIDLGAVRRINSRVTDVSWTTTGYRAPETDTAPPAPPSTAADLYTVGRTLAALTADFDMASADYLYRLPEPGEIEVFADHESLYRFLLKSTAPEPEHRFTSAAQMAEQLSGVLREVVASKRGVDEDRLNPVPSTLFTRERGAVGTKVADGMPGGVDPRTAALVLPLPFPDEGDPATSTLPALRSAEPQEVVDKLKPTTAEAAFRLVLAHLALPGLEGSLASARQALGTVREHDWRYVWYSGLLELADGAPRKAWREFAAVRDALPGELAPKLALAVCAEVIGEFELARHYYRTVWRTDVDYVSAAFGLARTYVLESPDNPGHAPITVLEKVPEWHYHHLDARLEALRLRLAEPDLDAPGLRETVRRFRALRLTESTAEEHLWLRAHLYEAARKLLAADPQAFGTEEVLDAEADDTSIGHELAGVYLALRPSARTRRDRVDLVRKAHDARPWTRY